MDKQINPRNLILDVLLSVESGSFLHVATREALDAHADLSRRDRAFVKRVSAGVMEHLIELDYIADQFSGTKVKKMKSIIRAIIRSGIYQIRYMDAVPDAAVVDEAVRLAKSRGLGGLSGFVNGVLRAIARKKNEITWPDEATEPIRALSVKYSMPEWIVQRFTDRYGREQCEEILAAYQREGLTWVRVDSRRSVSEVTKSLEASGITVTLHPDIPCAIAIEGYDSLASIPEFMDGTLYVQNPSSMLPALMADPQPGDLIVDVCAAPGGKAVHAARLLAAAEAESPADIPGRVLARDISEAKLRLIEENISRCRVNNISTRVWDATVPDPDLTGKTDIVIADLPCSGLGVMGGKPDIRYRVTEADIAALASLQREILDVVSAYVKPGGTLIYSTCTMTPEENQDNTRWFTATHPGFTQAQERTLLPGAGYDGFYIVKFRRNV